MVIITVIGVVTINAVAGRTVPGVAGRTPAAAAPAAGLCLSITRTGWVPVGCAEPHTAEIVQGWSASESSDVTLYEKCMTAGRAYLGEQWGQSGDSPTQAVWSVPPVMSSTVLVFGPGRRLVEGWSWRACVVRPILVGDAGAGYRGRLRDVPATGVLPAELRPCFNRPQAVGVVGVSCAARHAGEVLATRSLQVFDSSSELDAIATNPGVTAECLGIARRSTAAADPTYGGRLQVVVNLHATGMGFVVSKDSSGASASYVLYQASCALQAAGGRELSASIIGLGSGQLPLR